jgi:hypothetical protein
MEKPRDSKVDFKDSCSSLSQYSSLQQFLEAVLELELRALGLLGR